MSSFYTNASNINKKCDYFKTWIEETFLPCGIIFTTNSSKEIIKKNNLTPSQFMRPFGEINNLEIKIKDFEKQIINNFRFDFFDSENFHKNKNNISIYLNNCISYNENIPKFSIGKNQLNKNNYGKFIDNQTFFSNNYYNDFEKIIFEYCYFDENEFYQQPLLFFYIIDINDDNNSINEIKNNFPYLLKEIYDTDIIDIIIILNDKSDKNKFESNIQIKNNKIENIKKIYKCKVIYLEINSCDDPNNDHFDFFFKYFHKIEFYSNDYKKQKLGQFISDNEINNLSQQIYTFFKNDFNKKINRKILKLEEKSKINILDYIFEGDSFKYFNKITFKGAKKAELTLGIILFYLRKYRESYIHIKSLYKFIKGNNNYKKLEISLLQFKTLLKYIKIINKQKVNKEETIDLYVQNINLYKTSPEIKINIEAIRSLLINLKMFEDSFNYNDIKLILAFIANQKKNFRAFENEFLYALILEKTGYYYLFTLKPKIRFFAQHIITWCPKYWNLYLTKDNTEIYFKYLLYTLGILCDNFKLNEMSNENIKFSFLMTKKYLLLNLIKTCHYVKYEEGIIYFYLILLKLYKIPENLILSNKEIKEKQEEFLELSTQITKFIYNIKFPIDNSDIINFDKSSILIITKREDDILQKNYKTDFYNKFKKYINPKINIVYSLLSENDLSNFKYIDKLSNNEETYNYFIKKNIEVNINEIIKVKFNFTNPFPISDKYKSITFIFDKENLVECEKKNISLEGLEKKQIELSIKFIEKGKVSIIGISYIRADIHIIKNLFDYKINTNLYNQLKEEIKTDNKKIKRKKFSEYNILDNKDKRVNYSFDILDYNSNININIANNEQIINFYQFEIYFIPIKILNNSKYDIKRFSIFFECEEKILFPKFFYNNDIDLRKECIIYIPIVSLESGKKFLNVVFKFEDKKNDIEVKKFVLELNIIQSYDIECFDFFLGKQSDIIKQKIIIKVSTLNNQLINKDLFKERNNILIPQNFEIHNQEISFQNNSYINEIEINYFINQLNSKKEENNLFENIKFEEQYNNIFINNFFKSIEEKNIIFRFFLNDKENKTKNLLYIYNIKNKNNKIETPLSSLRHIIESHLKISYKIEDLNEEEKYISIFITFNLRNFNSFINNKLMELTIGIENLIDNEFEWIGIKNYIIKDLNKNKINISFHCIISNKLNKIVIKKIEEQLNKIYIEIVTNEKDKFRSSNYYSSYLIKKKN